MIDVERVCEILHEYTDMDIERYDYEMVRRRMDEIGVTDEELEAMGLEHLIREPGDPYISVIDR